MDMTPKTRGTARALGFTGHLALLLGFASFLLNSGSNSFSTLVLAVGAVLAGAGWIRAAPDERLLATIGAWFLALSPLMAIWIYGALYPTKLPLGPIPSKPL